MRAAIFALLLLPLAVAAQPTERGVVDGADLARLAARVEDAAAEGDGTAIEELVLYPDYIAHVFDDGFVFDDDREALTDEIRGSTLFGNLFAGTVMEGGSVRYLHEGRRDGAPVARFRILHADGGLTYVDLIAERDQTGAVRIADVYAFSTAERLSQTMRHMLRSVVPGMRRNPPPTRAGAVSGDEFIAAIGDDAAIIRLYPRLDVSAEIRQTFVVLYLQALSRGNEQTYAAALQAFERTFPNHTGIDLLRLDLYTLKSDDSQLAKTIDRLDAAVGGDPYLDFFRITPWIDAGQYALAEAAIERLAAAEPDLDAAHHGRLNLAVARNDTGTIRQELLALENDFGWAFDAEIIRTGTEWAAFAASPDFAAWEGERAGK